MEEYIHALEIRLTFLNKEEKEKVLDKYNNIINDKLKEGKTSNEIIKEIGNVDDVIKKECSKRNINYEYYIRSNNFDKNVTNISNIISNFIKDIIVVLRTTLLKNNLSSFLQCIVKIIVLILLFTLFKLPFIVISNFMYYINNIIFYPMHGVFNNISDIFLGIIYLLICITWTLKIFGNYTISQKKETDVKEIKKSVDKDYNWLNMIVRLLVYFILLIPLSILILASLLLFIFSVYLVLNKVKIVGISILFLSLTFLFSTMFYLIKSSINSTKETKIFPLVISILFFIVGIFTTIVDLSKFKYSANLNSSSIKNITENRQITLYDSTNNVEIINGTYDLLKDDNLIDNEIRFEVTYYDDYVDVEYKQENGKLIFKSILDSDIDYISKFKSMYKDIKNGYIFNYSGLNRISVKIYGNENTINRLNNTLINE